jgi:hypothetical protein
MKFQFAARVVGHELLEGEKPKADLDRVKVKLTLRPVRDTPGKAGSATFTVSGEEATRDFPIRRTLLISCEECQQQLFEAMAGGEDDAAPRRAPDANQVEIGLPRGDSPLFEPPVRGGKVTPINAARRRGRRRKQATEGAGAEDTPN